MKAGELFICGCCKEESPEGEAQFDKELQAPVCQVCHYNMIVAKVYLAKKAIYPSWISSHKRIKPDA